MHVLLVEDNFRLGDLVRQGLADSDYSVDWVRTICEAHASLAATHFDLLLLDLGLPDGDGLSMVHALRSAKSSIPIIVLTARTGLDDRVMGLDAGADDFLVKPFAMEELAARCRALLRRPGNGLGPTIAFENIVFNPAERTILINGAPIDMGRKEKSLLEVLLRRPGKVVPRQNLEEAIYSMDDEVTPNALEAVISRLRKRLVAFKADAEVRTVHGVGYAIFSKEPK
eukprot:GHVR01126760.1.p1 GENE.GHVR01126760.1~~GHVR01126760.1.p1  ORF type:complete len:227 (-),score=19.66 GHVR01126760.1:481-1161(-)